MTKKLLAGVIVFLFLSTACIYIFIPSKLEISHAIPVNYSAMSVARFLEQDSNWVKWRPSHLSVGGWDFRVGKRLSNITEVILQKDKAEFPGWLTVVPKARIDSASINLEYSLASGWNPVQRILQYREARSIRAATIYLLDSLRSYLYRKGPYGIPIRETSTTDSFLIATRSVYSVYPGTHESYAVLKKLKEYGLEEGAKETGYPMLNITQLSNNQFQMMVAIPVDKAVKPTGDYHSQKLVPGKFLFSEVRGGMYTVNKSFEEMRNYVTDYQKTTMAIPFQSLVTDRSAEPDTSKWITRLYYPVF